MHDFVKAVMFSALVIIGALFVGSAFGANPARGVARKFIAADANCTVAVVAPGKALTAAHCLPLIATGGTIDGLPVAKGVATPGRDIAKLDVPGLACPCVPISPRRAHIDERVIVVGFPYNSPVAVITEGHVMGDHPLGGEPYVISTAPVGPGNSGGPVMIVVDGRLFLVGVASMGPPQGALMLYAEPIR